MTAEMTDRCAVGRDAPLGHGRGAGQRPSRSRPGDARAAGRRAHCGPDRCGRRWWAGGKSPLTRPSPRPLRKLRCFRPRAARAAIHCAGVAGRRSRAGSVAMIGGALAGWWRWRPPVACGRDRGLTRSACPPRRWAIWRWLRGRLPLECWLVAPSVDSPGAALRGRASVRCCKEESRALVARTSRKAPSIIRAATRRT